MEDSEKLAFWGIVLKPGEPAELDLEDGETLQITMASLGAELVDKNGRSVVSATIRNSAEENEEEMPEKKYALSALTAGKMETVCMNVSFIGEESVVFHVTGKNNVHLVGNFSFENDVDDEDEFDDGNDLIGVYDDDNDMSDSDDDDDDDDDNEPRLLLDKDPPIITELPDNDDEEDGDKKVVVAKKKGDKGGKIANGKHEEPTGKKGSAHKKGSTVRKLSERDLKQRKELPVIDDEEEEEEDSDEDDESEGEADGGDAKPTSSSDGDDEDESEEEDEPEDEIRANVPKTKVKNVTSAKKGAGGKPRLSFEEAPAGDDDDEKATPTGAKSKRQRKRSVSIGVPDGVTPPQNKKSKVSQRPATPAPVKTAQRGGKQSTPSASGSKGSARANATAKAGAATPSAKENASPASANGSTSGKRKRRRSRKGGDSS